MLSYAFQALKDQGLREVDIEPFDNAQKLCAEIFLRCVNTQIKRGLGREYISTSETAASVRGKIDVSESIKTQSLLRRRLICEYDDYSTNTRLNQVMKATLTTLLRMDILPAQKKEAKNLLVFFDDVQAISLHQIDWAFQYNKSNASYQLLVSICYLIINGYLQTQIEGTTKLLDFFDEQRMSRLYEKFILEYYRRHYPELSPAAAHINWQLDFGEDTFLPTMKSDIMLRNDYNVLIIDAKYYSHSTQIQYDKHTVHSGNLYQIFTYVKNKEYELRDVDHTPVAGVLLYAKTDEEIHPECEYSMSGNRILVRTLDLNADFPIIADQLDQLVDYCMK